MVPQQPDWTIDDILATNRSAWMLVDKSLITMDGVQDRPSAVAAVCVL
jgi:hypothetical protein